MGHEMGEARWTSHEEGGNDGQALSHTFEKVTFQYFAVSLTRDRVQAKSDIRMQRGKQRDVRTQKEYTRKGEKEMARIFISKCPSGPLALRRSPEAVTGYLSPCEA